MKIERQGTMSATVQFRVRTHEPRSRPLRADLTYESSDPFVVTLACHTSRGVVRWLLSRDILLQGLDVPAGEGDVRIRPDEDPDTLLIELVGPGGNAVLEVSRQDVRTFVDETCLVVPPGEEENWFDIEAELANLSVWE